jgi:hypothetical protein
MLTDTRFLIGVAAGLALGWGIRHWQAQRAEQG